MIQYCGQVRKITLRISSYFTRFLQTKKKIIIKNFLWHLHCIFISLTRCWKFLQLSCFFLAIVRKSAMTSVMTSQTYIYASYLSTIWKILAFICDIALNSFFMFIPKDKLGDFLQFFYVCSKSLTESMTISLFISFAYDSLSSRQNSYELKSMLLASMASRSHDCSSDLFSVADIPLSVNAIW